MAGEQGQKGVEGELIYPPESQIKPDPGAKGPRGFPGEDGFPGRKGEVSNNGAIHIVQLCNKINIRITRIF